MYREEGRGEEEAEKESMRHGEGAGSLDECPDSKRNKATLTAMPSHCSQLARRAQRLHILLSDDPAGPQLGNAPRTHQDSPPTCYAFYDPRLLWSINRAAVCPP